jgi:putative membrane protein
MSILRYLTWLVRLFLFLVLLLFALKNTVPVRLHFFFDTGWDVPLVVLLLGFFAAGAVLGVMACLGGLIRQRRQIGSLKRELDERAAAGRPAVAPLPALPPDPGM